MLSNIDAPLLGVTFDPEDFRIRGWLWLDDQHGEIAAIEAYAGAALIGEAAVSALHERADISARQDLPPGTRTGFDFPARHPAARPRQPFELLIRARLHDGARTPPLCTRLLAVPPLERHPYRMLGARVAAGALGLEIGAHTAPLAGLSPFFTDVVANYAGVTGRVDFLADARALPLADGTLDYLCSSHVIEHLPDPIAALHEWHRVLRPGGLLYLVAPDQRFTFDAPRATTTVEHLLRDFREGVTAADAAAHVEEFVFRTDWSRLSPRTAPADVAPEQAAARTRYLGELAAGRAIDIHYHTFTPVSLDVLLRAAGFIGGESAGFELLAQAERYPPGREDGIGFLLAKAPPPPRISKHVWHRPPFSYLRTQTASPRCRSCARSLSSRCARKPRPPGSAHSSPLVPAPATRARPAGRRFCHRPGSNRSGRGPIRAGVRLGPRHR